MKLISLWNCFNLWKVVCFLVVVLYGLKLRKTYIKIIFIFMQIVFTIFKQFAIKIALKTNSTTTQYYDFIANIPHFPCYCCSCWEIIFGKKSGYWIIYIHMYEFCQNKKIIVISYIHFVEIRWKLILLASR